MEGLCWDYSQDFTYTTSTLWTSQENQDALIASDPSSCLLSGKNTGLADDIFIQDQPLQHAHTSQINLNSNRLQETSGLVTSWEDTSTQDFFSSSLIETGFGSNDQSTIINGLRNGNDGGVSTGSFDSLDCLLSATNSTTDTSVEDDSISVIFSTCRNLWKHGNKSVASSAESEGEIHCRDEGTSSYQTTKTSVCAKRSKDQSFDMIQTSKPKRQRSEKKASSTNINFQQPNSSMSSSIEEADPEAIAQMKEMLYRAAAFRPVNLGIEVVEKPKRKNVKISCDPQTVAARQRRERISERIRVLQRLVPGGTKMDTASMLDEAANYLKFLRSQVKALENFGHKLEVNSQPTNNIAFSSLPFNNYSYSFHPMQTHLFSSLQNPNHIHHHKVGKD